MNDHRTDLLVVGGGPAGASAAAWSAAAGVDVTVVDSVDFPRDKPCGDGLTPRAILEMRELGMGDWLQQRPRNWGLRAAGFGRTWHLPWPGGSLPDQGSAAPRTELDAALLAVARERGARVMTPARVVAVEPGPGGRIGGVTVRRPEGSARISFRRMIVADGARSPVGRLVGRQWHRETVYGVAARAYVTSDRSDDPWISSHLELRGEDGDVLSGYGWIFPLGDGGLNLGVGTLATSRRPADVNLRNLLMQYYRLRRTEWRLTSEPRAIRSALLPMGGAVSGVAGPNWMLIGDAAACVNPLNGEGIDYGIETGRLAAELLSDSRAGTDLAAVWPQMLFDRYGAAFSAARRIAALLTQPELLRRAGPWGMRSRALMEVALRVMGNLVTEQDRDLLARVWRLTGALSLRLDSRPPFS